MGRCPSRSFSATSKEDGREKTEGNGRQREEISKPAPERAQREMARKRNS